MRGTPIDAEQAFAYPGIIPAYAGNTESWCMWFRPAGDHPRVCGEHIYVTNPDLLDSGSSPRMRGTPRYHRCPGIADGIIPAYAGNTIPPVSTPAARRDHPRVCGEHISRNMTSLLTWGSSPRMRGTLKAYNHGNRNPGIIPAYAGNTTLQSRRPDQHGDHPRVCGEHCVGVHFAFEAAGSSPRMRGTRQLRQLGRQRPRIIPAYAGNTMACKPFLRPIRDHPRVCGEHPVTTPDSDTVAGSSPRMRGTHHRAAILIP